jgi:hypothetical protein
MAMPYLPSQVADSLVNPGKSVKELSTLVAQRVKFISSSTMSFGRMSTPAAFARAERHRSRCRI